MAKETFIARFALIIRRLEKGPCTYQQIADYLQMESEIQERNFSISIRTLQRDINDIYTHLNIEIVNEKTGDKRYFIKNKPESKNNSLRLLESYQIIHAINASHDFADSVFLETRKSSGLEHFHAFLYAINNKRVLNFNHYKYWDEVITKRIVHPLGLKESQGRWYLIAVDTKDLRLKTFGLDRIDEVEVKSPFEIKYQYNIKDIFTNSFGIVTIPNKDPETVQLKFTQEQGCYIKTYPLHHSQNIINEKNDGMVVELKIHVTHDFIKELLSYGPEVEVLSPVSLRKTIKQQLSKTTMLYP